jgi:hypothetical protein
MVPCRRKSALPWSKGERPEMNGRADHEKCSMRLWVIGAGLSIVLLLGMMVLDRALKTPEAPAGIISFELAGTLDRAESIIGAWDAPARIKAGVSLGLDFFFLVTYAGTLYGACRWVAARLASNRLQRLGTVLAWAAWGAAFLDTIENLALIQVLIGHGEAWHPLLAAVCAWPKFGLAGGALLYIFTGGAMLFWARRKRAGD